ncbi:type I-F CRISPR-associated protein Csy1 [Acidovorax sp. GW101-3H11]|uniref:type I-F CRISPR-associated protein Csy1 n=1 Tax=Acidovorax sp. GW101-3H11 TaxID=1813946 RepID=UPI0007B509AE|nr:type I-F CRISPR-associated protein Csy1 [Acidovorax sp. GW101-3H11]KZT15569.1 type I-F CRISPR-associated protein Csy1 [Acidovorax sp. GW101-3H11]
MSEAPATGGKAGYRAAISAFLQERLQAKLDKLKPDDPQRDEVIASFAHDVWLANAAKRVEQIQAVTHSLKPIHPDARGTNFYVEPRTLPSLAELGSHALGERFVGDVVGNAAALDVYKLLKLEVSGRSLLAALLAHDADALAALHADQAQAQALRDAFVSLTQPRAEGPSSHTLAKQLYWLTGSDACDDAHYTLLAPLYATSLAHAVHAQLQEDRFGETNKAARQARRERKMHDGVFHDYPGLAVQNMGGTKPQNISQLNSERRGVNYLLSSLPPQWKASAVRLPVHATSVFDRLFIARPEVRRTVRALRVFLESDPDAKLATRERREELLDALVDELVSLAAELQQILPPGWSRDDERFKELIYEEALWLDPLRAEIPEEAQFAHDWQYTDWPAAIGKAFGNWLNAQLRGKLPMGDAEAREWKKVFLTDDDGFKQQLRELRDKLGTPHYIPIRKTHAEPLALREENP